MNAKNGIFSKYVIPKEKKDEMRDDGVYYGYGPTKGIFTMTPDILYDMYTTCNVKKNYVFSERKTENYKYCVDLDFKDDRESDIDDCSGFLQEVIDTLAKLLPKYTKKENTRYIICDKNDGSKGYHIYYPDIIVNNKIACEIRTELMSTINFDISDKAKEEIIDISIYKGTGLRPIFIEYNESYYKINKKLSTYDIPNNKKEQFLLTSLRTDADLNTTSMQKENKKRSVLPVKKNDKPKTNDVDLFLDINAGDNKGKQISKDLLKEILNCYKKKRCSDRNMWIEIGMILRNISEDNIDVWNEWSTSCEKHEPGCCEREWKSFRNVARPLHLGTLLKWVKEDNPNRFIDIQNKVNNESKVHDLIKFNREKFPGNNLESYNIYYSINNEIIIALPENTYCPFIRDYDESHSIRLRITTYGMFMECGHKLCINKSLPQPIIPLTQNIFNVQIINNYDKKDSNQIELDDVEIDENIVVFEDDKELNTLILNSLNGTAYDIAKVFYYLAKDKYNCSVDKEWYIFDKYWMKNNSTVREYISNELVEKYKSISKYYKNQLKSNRTFN